MCCKYFLYLYLFEYQDVSQTNTNIRIIRIIRIMDIRMRTLLLYHDMALYLKVEVVVKVSPNLMLPLVALLVL